MNSKYIAWLKKDKRSSLRELKKDITRLKRGEPLAYVIGWVDFLGCRIDLSHKPLIPRPETEYWTEKAIGEIRSRIQKLESRRRIIRVLDVFAGSGCIGIAVLKRVPNAKVWFADKDPACLRQIRKNLKLNRIPAHRYEIKHSNILQNVGMSFDYVLANPPYIPSGRKLPASVSKFEAGTALFGGKDGLRFIRAFARELPRVLAPGGRAWMEFDSGERREVEKIFRKFPVREFHRDQFGRIRYATLGML
ncbi:MAG: Protoporphyrinogen oxidase [Parcubacteria group bacterium GW2011_GWA1_59_11]|nr:MAG: Protoporphyrinogen oxidase [Parcubacteria group bacterium GW2011_GWA1_59_11]